MDYQILIARYPVVVRAYGKLLDETKGDKEKYGEFFLKQIKSSLHGIAHWVRVGIYGLTIAEHLFKNGRAARHWLSNHEPFEQAVLYACFFHDTCRDGEGLELEHGRRAEKLWRTFAEERKMNERILTAVSHALLFHVAHRAVDPFACDVTICLCNADRLDRVRLGEKTLAKRMYDDGVWQDLAQHSERLLREVNMARIEEDFGDILHAFEKKNRVALYL